MAALSPCRLHSCGFRPPQFQSTLETLLRPPSAAPRLFQIPAFQERPPHRDCSASAKPPYKGRKIKAASLRQAASQGSVVSDAPALPAPHQDLSTEQLQQPAAAKRSEIQWPEDAKVFSWKQFWYPVAILADLDVQKPTTVTLLNIELVLWRDQGGAWAALLDKCPHRSAPLSEGRVEGGILHCAYHGWAFNAKGTCVANPHADGPEAEAKACSDRRSRCQSFPTREGHGLLWVWPKSGADAWLEASAHALPEHPELLDPEWVGSEGPFNRIDEPINWDIMVENAMDPAHAPFLHHGLVAKMEDYRPMHAKLAKASDDPNQGFEIQHDGYTQHQKDEDFKGTRRFTPNGIRVAYEYKSGRVDLYVIHFVPMKPGWTRGFLKLVYKNPPGIIKLVNRLPAWLLHSNALAIPDQDVLVLHKQDRNLRTALSGTKAYFTPNESDGGVIAFRTWLREKAGGDVGWENGATSADVGPRLPRNQLLNRFNRHASGCHVCLQAMATIDRIRSALSFGAGVLSLLGMFVAIRQETSAEIWVPAFVGAAVMLGVKELLRKFRRNYVTGCNSSEVDLV